MASPTPWQLANVNRRPVTVRTPVFVRDTYNFSSVSVSNGTNPTVAIPATGPNAAGAPPPSSTRSVDHYEVTVTGTERNVVYGVNVDHKV